MRVRAGHGALKPGPDIPGPASPRYRSPSSSTWMKSFRFRSCPRISSPSSSVAPGEIRQAAGQSQSAGYAPARASDCRQAWPARSRRLGLESQRAATQMSSRTAPGTPPGCQTLAIEPAEQRSFAGYSAAPCRASSATHPVRCDPLHGDGGTRTTGPSTRGVASAMASRRLGSLRPRRGSGVPFPLPMGGLMQLPSAAVPNGADRGGCGVSCQPAPDPSLPPSLAARERHPTAGSASASRNAEPQGTTLEAHPVPPRRVNHGETPALSLCGACFSAALA